MKLTMKHILLSDLFKVHIEIIQCLRLNEKPTFSTNQKYNWWTEQHVEYDIE